jgi:hypothetical protein
LPFSSSRHLGCTIIILLNACKYLSHFTCFVDAGWLYMTWLRRLR